MRFIRNLLVGLTIGGSGIAAPLAAVQAAPLSMEHPAATGQVYVQKVRIVCGANGCKNEGPPGYNRDNNRSGYRPYEPGYFGVRPERNSYRTLPRSPLRTGRAHENWCQSRYRTYNSGTNRYFNGSGYYNACRSPFRQSGN